MFKRIFGVVGTLGVLAFGFSEGGEVFAHGDRDRIPPDRGYWDCDNYEGAVACWACCFALGARVREACVANQFDPLYCEHEGRLAVEECRKEDC